VLGEGVVQAPAEGKQDNKGLIRLLWPCLHDAADELPRKVEKNA
jgi:hypothetical protein